MAIREITEADIPLITDLSRRALEFEQDLSESLVLEKTVGAVGNDRELGLLIEDGGRIIAFAQGVIGGELDGRPKGCVRMFAVDRAYRRQHFGSTLFDELEERLKSKGAGIVTIMDAPANYLTPGVDFRYTETYCFLLKRGYSVFRENHNMRCSLDVDAWPELDANVTRVSGDDLEIRRATGSDEDAIVEMLLKEWKGWVPEVTSALKNDPAGVYIALLDGEVVAFAGFQGNNKSLPFFGPMGTLPVLRGRGVGGVLLRLCLRDLARQGWGYAIIPWVGPVGFYAQYCGAWLDRCFWAYKKEV
jgi:predicted N-acetyltransferase YhbS